MAQHGAYKEVQPHHSTMAATKQLKSLLAICFVFWSSGVPFLTWTYLDLNKRTHTIDCVWLCSSLLMSSTLLPSDRRGCCSLCRSETLAKGLPATHSHCNTNAQALSLFHVFFFLDVAKLLLSVWTIYRLWHMVLDSLSRLQQLNTRREVRAVTTTSEGSRSFFYLHLALCVSSLSPFLLQSDTNSLRKIGPTAKATTDFLFNVLKPVARLHETTSASVKKNNNNNLSLLLLVLLCIVAPARHNLYIVPYKLLMLNTNMLLSCPTHMEGLNTTFRLCLGVVAALAVVWSS